MAIYPEVQAKAQAELDAVVGLNRLPVVGDEGRLPYVESLIKELHRFNPIVPLIPHSILRDDEYRGYHIPKGSWIMANSWQVLPLFLRVGTGCRAEGVLKPQGHYARFQGVWAAREILA